MGLYVYFRGELECIRCQRLSDALIQTKLLHTDADNFLRSYRVGDSEVMVMDGLDDFCPLYPWDGGSPLVMAVGDWACDHCSLNWQWARVVLDVRPGESHPTVSIRDLSTFRPWQPSDLDGVHFVEPDLAELSGLWASPPSYNWSEGWDRWQACSLTERCERVSVGFRDWCREVAGVSPRSTPGN